MLAGVNVNYSSEMYRRLSRSPYFADKTGILGQYIWYSSGVRDEAAWPCAGGLENSPPGIFRVQT